MALKPETIEHLKFAFETMELSGLPRPSHLTPKTFLDEAVQTRPNSKPVRDCLANCEEAERVIACLWGLM
jgi:hypothetical protein